MELWSSTTMTRYISEGGPITPMAAIFLSIQTAAISHRVYPLPVMVTVRAIA